ncbi:hypothetical protein, variant 1 [Blastomyces dermatitidis ER-3]|uniref:Uncharacterized protein n=2 Tax=Blastomyces TaxID=229219 RepID=A0A179UPY7_BLAGS|nr:hypothetical protein, variant 1 [Blastomyces gilchristii SLH14081]XP_045280069.1 hypothetical protein, variant 1 [Blastomyces dermatitidis ER-3]OAT00342.1 hypothetical protein, variant 1 [Blastomyces dermatitidis ER-3]OAT10084.1 hypothetical protein, variant 1 [Blastomyces gilchristii SLH14081]
MLLKRLEPTTRPNCKSAEGLGGNSAGQDEGPLCENGSGVMLYQEFYDTLRQFYCPLLLPTVDFGYLRLLIFSGDVWLSERMETLELAKKHFRYITVGTLDGQGGRFYRERPLKARFKLGELSPSSGDKARISTIP